LFIREITLLGVLNHPNIVRCVAACTVPTQLAYLIPWYAGGSLDKCISTQPNVIKEKQISIALKECSIYIVWEYCTEILNLSQLHKGKHLCLALT